MSSLAALGMRSSRLPHCKSGIRLPGPAWLDDRGALYFREGFVVVVAVVGVVDLVGRPAAALEIDGDIALPGGKMFPVVWGSGQGAWESAEFLRRHGSEQIMSQLGERPVRWIDDRSFRFFGAQRHQRWIGCRNREAEGSRGRGSVSGRIRRHDGDVTKL